MNWEVIKSVGKVAFTVANVAITIYEVKKIAKEVKNVQEHYIEEQVRKNTGDETFNLAEYNAKKKELKDGLRKKAGKKVKGNVVVNIDVDGTPIKVWVVKSTLKVLAGMAGVAGLIYGGIRLLTKIPVPQFATKFIKFA